MNKLFNKIKNRFSFYMVTSFKGKNKKVKRKISKQEKILKYTTIILFPSLAVASGVVLGFSDYNKNHHSFDTQVVVSSDMVKRKIFLVSSDNFTIPITVSLNQRTTLQQEILDVFDLLKVDSLANSKYVTGFINSNTKVNSFNLQNKILELNMSKEFLESNINSANVIEALTLTFLQFEEIDELRLFVEGELLNSYNNIPLPSSLDYSFGINEQLTSTKEKLGKKKMIVFGERQYDASTSYLVPVSLYVEEKESDNLTFVEALNKGFSTGSKLNELEIYQGISSYQEVSVDFKLNVNTSSLNEENFVNKELFDIVNLSLNFMGLDQYVSFVLEGESLQVDGVYTQEDYSVSSFVINEVKL